MEHTSKQFEIELEDLRSGLLAMGGLVEAQLERALEAIASHEEELVEVVLREEKRVNDKQIELDRKGMEIIAKRQPAAVDLRQIICTMPLRSNSICLSFTRFSSRRTTSTSSSSCEAIASSARSS